MAIALTKPSIGSTDWGTDVNNNWQELLDALNSGTKTIGPVNFENAAGNYIRLPNMATADRPASPADGMIIFNTTTNEFEGYKSAAWGSLGGGGDTLPVVDTTSIVKDPADNTKQMRIDVGAVGTGLTRVLTMPNQDVDLMPGNTFQAHDADLDALAGLSTTGGIERTGAGTAAIFTLTAAGKALLDDADAAAQRTTLGLVIGTDVQAYDAGLQSIAGLTTLADRMIYTTALDTYAVTTLTAFARTLLDDADAATARTTLGVAIGTDVQAWDADLDALAGLSTTGGIERTGAGTAAIFTLTAAGKALLDDADAAAQRTTLGLVIGTDVQAWDAGLQSIAGLTTLADRMIYTTALDTYAVTTLTAFARTLLDDADAATARTTLGVAIGTDVQAWDADLDALAGLSTTGGIERTGAGTAAIFTLTAAGKALLDDADAAAQRTTLGLVIGTDVQAYDAGLQSIAGLTTLADKMIYTTALDTYAVTTLTAFARTLLDDADAATARTTLGVAIGTDVQAWDAGLQSIAGLTTAADKMIYTTALDTYAVTTLTAFARTLLDDADAATARTTLGVAIGTDVQAYDADLAAIAGLASNGLIARTGAGTAAARSIAAGTGISVTNGDGVSGNPTVALDINGMTAEATAADADEIAIYDASAAALRKMTRANFLAGAGTRYDYILIRDEKSSGTNGGTFTKGAWQTRDLNTEVVDEGGDASVSSNQVTLSSGTYYIFSCAGARQVSNHQLRWQNVTDGTTAVLGINAADPTNYQYTDTTLAVLVGRFTIASSKTFELQHRCASTKPNVGFGRACSWGTEVYASVQLWKIA